MDDYFNIDYFRKNMMSNPCAEIPLLNIELDRNTLKRKILTEKIIKYNMEPNLTLLERYGLITNSTNFNSIYLTQTIDYTDLLK
jgi:hypothetical protein